MGADISDRAILREASWADAAVRSDVSLLRTIVIAAGICWSIVFVAIGLRYQLQMYADGSIFSYSVAVEDTWAFHWHNISGRLFVYLFSLLPAEAYVALTRDAHGGIVLYGFLFFVAQLLGLLATFAADRSRGRIIFTYACASTACLCPLVFGFPTEMWMAHALFWPALAVCHYTRGIGGTILVFALLLALAFTHLGALILAFAIMATLLLRGVRDTAFPRAASAFLVVILILDFVRAAFRPDDYIAVVLANAATHVFDVGILRGDLIVLLFGALAGYAIAFHVISRLNPEKAHVYAAAFVAAALAAHWLWFDHTLHADNRYCLRTVLLIVTPLFGVLAAASALDADGQFNLRIPLLRRLMAARASAMAARAFAGAFLLIMLVHAVETAKFVAAWTNYTAGVRALAMGAASDAALGNPRFVSSDRIRAGLNRLSWSSTTHFLSVLAAPNFAPARLVVDPAANYFWLPCKTAAASANASRAVPAISRELVRAHACLHR